MEALEVSIRKHLPEKNIEGNTNDRSKEIAKENIEDKQDQNSKKLCQFFKENETSKDNISTAKIITELDKDHSKSLPKKVPTVEPMINKDFQSKASDSKTFQNASNTTAFSPFIPGPDKNGGLKNKFNTEINTNLLPQGTSLLSQEAVNGLIDIYHNLLVDDIQKIEEKQNELLNTKLVNANPSTQIPILSSLTPNISINEKLSSDSLAPKSDNIINNIVSFTAKKRNGKGKKGQEENLQEKENISTIYSSTSTQIFKNKSEEVRKRSYISSKSIMNQIIDVDPESNKDLDLMMKCLDNIPKPQKLDPIVSDLSVPAVEANPAQNKAFDYNKLIKKKSDYKPALKGKQYDYFQTMERVKFFNGLFKDKLNTTASNIKKGEQEHIINKKDLSSEDINQIEEYVQKGFPWKREKELFAMPDLMKNEVNENK